MPVILRVKGYKFWFYEADLGEPHHVHAGNEGREAKFWLEPIQLARAGRFKPGSYARLNASSMTIMPSF